MHSKFPAKSHHRVSPQLLINPNHHHQFFCKIVCCAKNSSPQENKNKFKLLGQSLGDNKWKFNDVDGNAVQETLNVWVSKTQNFLNEVTSPLVKNVHDKKPSLGKNAFDTQNVDDIFMAEQTVDSKTPNGELSFAAIVSIEQFSRMNGLTGKKMQMIFKALVPESLYDDPRNLVEYCCFRFLSRDSSEIHPCLKQPAFQRLIFVTMLAWEYPCRNVKDPLVNAMDVASYQKRIVGKKAFVRIAPAISGVADWPTAHNLFKALAGDEKGISFSTWSTYIDELVKVHEGRKSYRVEENPYLSRERLLCLGSSRKRPVLKWKNNMAWPGKLTLTDRALYFEAVDLVGQRDAIRMDLTRKGAWVEKARVGPLGSDIFDSAISVTSGSDCWVLEFVDLGGEMRRDAWFAFISEVLALYKFTREFGPKDGDRSISNVYGAQKGKSRALTYAISGIARLQALQFMRKLLDEPTKLVQFSYLQSAPYGDVVCQTLAVNCWGGPLVTKVNDGYQPGGVEPSEDVSDNNHLFDIDGSVYLRKWMRSPSWGSGASIAFWKNASIRHGVVLNKNLVVADVNLVEKAAITCRDKYKVVQKTQATIDAAMLEGIPSNIDLFKELLLPLTVIAKNFDKLRRWEEPHLTASFLAFAYTIIFRNMLSYIFPTTLMILAAGMLLLKGLKEQGRLGRFFGKVTIHDQPPSNTIQKILAVKEAMRDVEKYLQKLNVSLLKMRTIVLAGQPQITTEVALVLLLTSTVLLIVPFKYVISFVILDFFTRELDFRRETVIKFMSMLKERWDTVPAAPVVVLPFKGEETDAASQKKEFSITEKSEKAQERQ
ncbi:hypothetical protein LguiB_021873 [Lonicera macranthoides]